MIKIKYNVTNDNIPVNLEFPEGKYLSNFLN